MARLMTNPSARADVRNSIVQQYDATSTNGTPRSATQTPPSERGRRGGGDCGHEADMMHTPPLTAEDEEAFRDAELQAKIMRQAEENGITRPRGHKVSFHYNSHVEDMHFGKTHPMKPWRLTLTKHLVLGHGLHYAMDTYEATAATKEDVCAFHNPDYVDFLAQVSPESFQRLSRMSMYRAAIPPAHEGDAVELGPFNLSTSPGADCPVFDGMSTYLFLYTGATLAASQQLRTGNSDIAINWSGGLHHAHKGEASGFCYINDIVLAIQDLLTVYVRVLYIDIDVHHGDGVEEAFQRSPRVMTLSFHRYGPYDDTGHRFFPGTGNIDDIGVRGTRGQRFAQNVPIPSGIDDRQYNYLFTKCTGNAIEAFKPQAIVLQCGADSLGGDRLGQFNINIKQHGECISYIKKHGIPLLILGGGGYTARNVARAWCYETALATDNTLPDHIPMHLVPRPEAFQGRQHGDGKMFPSFERLHKNECKDADLERMVKKLHSDLQYVRSAPWVRMDALPFYLPSEERQAEMMAELERAAPEEKAYWRRQKMERDKERESQTKRRELERDPAGRGELR